MEDWRKIVSVVNQAQFAGKVAFVTGGGEGIGRAIALQFAKRGASVVVTARTESKIKATVQLIESFGGKGLAVTCDVRKEHEVKAALQWTKEFFGRLDIAVNNAGVDERASPSADQSADTDVAIPQQSGH
jgi:NAD(P)-dependent dehydrogenase (short-subunit alcohol dehydrogenase family)